MDDSEENAFFASVRNFLREFKEIMGEGQRYIILGHHLKNMETLVQMGLTVQQRDDIIRTLKATDYYAGPIADQYKKGNYWVFGKKTAGVELYIKLKIATDGHGNDYAICMSFHQAEFPLKYPLKK